MTNDLATLVGSRICHDLISPIGAIGNGVELMSLSQPGDCDAEMALIATSAAHASARIRFFRVAFGAASPGQSIATRDVLRLLSDHARGSRITYDWQPAGDLTRDEVRIAFLLMMCLEQAMAQGGKITVSRTSGHWTVGGHAPRLRLDVALWDALARPGTMVDVTAAQVQFALLSQITAQSDTALQVLLADNTVVVRFGHRAALVA
ncbi:histidine phosphotransferase ChpT [Loktanella fryxellensis]|uniref:Histidine phosphotransferase ChpT n=1 Tax=Loktanella fryxellensis TaxID=245187 RepID=A0A1H8F2T2_9RHOB|nr:histidine phosphotransferase family protein [Loktanella fryxellensis]SEN26042.1 histidine phosphotransferase ChpT [Loktanella fryxellensis]